MNISTLGSLLLKPKLTIIDTYHKYRDLYDTQNNVGRTHVLTIRLFRKELQIYFYLTAVKEFKVPQPVTIGLSTGSIQWVACPSGASNQKVQRIDRVLNCLNMINQHNFANTHLKGRVWQKLAEVQGVEVGK